MTLTYVTLHYIKVIYGGLMYKLLNYYTFYVFLCSSDSISGPRVLLSLILNKYTGYKTAEAGNS